MAHSMTPAQGKFLSAGRKKLYGERLKSARNEKNLSIMKTFLHLEYVISLSQIREYENGNTIMNGILMYRFCVLYGKDIRAFFVEDYDGRYDHLAAGRDSLENEYVLQRRLRENLRRMREEMGLTTSAMAAKAGITAPGLSQYESGKRIPMCSILWKICETMGVSVFDLFAPAKSEKEERSTSCKRTILAI